MRLLSSKILLFSKKGTQMSAFFMANVVVLPSIRQPTRNNFDHLHLATKTSYRCSFNI